MKIDVMVASVGHLKYVKVINDTIDDKTCTFSQEMSI